MLSRAVSSVGQSPWLTPRGSLVRTQYRPPPCRLKSAWASALAPDRRSCMNPAILIVIVIVVVLVAVLVGIYNGLIQKRLRIDEAFAQIEVQLKRRHDLIPNLVNAVKGYMGLEQKVLTDVTNARAA